MTEKRYYNIITTGDIKDELTGELFKGSAIGDRLNEQHETITTQATQIDYLKDENRHMRQLVNENKELKQFIDDLYKKYEDAHGMSIENTDWF